VSVTMNSVHSSWFESLTTNGLPNPFALSVSKGL
jgi:hypothetical protein